jgi:NO-binding membrane sensor protein with MHYT domain
MLPTTYHPALVALSALIATLASYVALDVAGRITPGTGCARWAWVVAAAISLGGGIWSMHFVGMLAMQLPVAIWYDIPKVLLSALVAVAASSVALGITTGTGKAGQKRLIPAALTMGTAVAGMHYIGMAAMSGPFFIQYNIGIIVASYCIAVVASYVALWLLTSAPNGVTSAKLVWRRWIAAGAMGVASCGMHYTGMYAAEFCRSSGANISKFGTLATTSLAVTVAMFTLMILAVGLTAAAADRRFKALESEALLGRSPQAF